MIKKIIKLVKMYIKTYFSSDIFLLSTNLTYVMLIAIFPFFAIFLGISKGFGIDEKIIIYLRSSLSQNEIILTYILDVANKLIEDSKTSILTGLGLILLIMSVVKMLDILEKTFNELWHIKKRRKYASRLISYIAIIFTLPICIILMFATSSYIFDFLSKYLGNLSYLIYIIMKILNITLSILFILILFIVLPNKRVNIIPAFIGSTITFIGLYILYKLFILLNFNIGRYNIIYGSLAFVPIFLLWLRLFWTIILIGSQITYTIQTSNEFVYDKIKMSFYLKRNISLFLLYIIIKNFEENKKAYSFKELEKYTNLPSDIIAQCLKLLQNTYLINEVSNEKETFYQLNKNPNYINLKYCLNTIECYEKEDEDIYYKLLKDKDIEKINEIIKQLEIKNDKLLKDI